MDCRIEHGAFLSLVQSCARRRPQAVMHQTIDGTERVEVSTPWIDGKLSSICRQFARQEMRHFGQMSAAVAPTTSGDWPGGIDGWLGISALGRDLARCIRGRPKRRPW